MASAVPPAPFAPPVVQSTPVPSFRRSVSSTMAAPTAPTPGSLSSTPEEFLSIVQKTRQELEKSMWQWGPPAPQPAPPTEGVFAQPWSAARGPPTGAHAVPSQYSAYHPGAQEHLFLTGSRAYAPMPLEVSMHRLEATVDALNSRVTSLEIARMDYPSLVAAHNMYRMQCEMQILQSSFHNSLTAAESAVATLLKENQALHAKIGIAEPRSPQEQAEIQSPRRTSRVQQLTSEVSSSVGKETQPIRSEVPGDPPYPQKFNPRQRRYSVSSESFNPASVKMQPIPHHEKDSATRERILSVLQREVTFSHLRLDQLQEAIDAMRDRKLPAGEIIIKEGELGDEMFLIERGVMDVFYGTTLVATLGPGKAFGEVSLMYNCPRTATVKAKTDALLWVIERPVFRRIVMQESIRRRAKYESTLAKVKLLAGLLPYERAKIADALDLVNFKDGEVILRQGDTKDDKFFIIESGVVQYWKSPPDDPNKPPILSGTGSKGDYFGELALLENTPRQATVQANGDVSCICISKKHFDQVMGPCEAILRANRALYKTYEQLSEESNVTLVQTQPPMSESKELPDETLTPTSFVDILNITKEFADHEREHTKLLHVLVNGFMKPLAAQDEVPITEKDISLIFGQSEALLRVHESFGTKLARSVVMYEADQSPYIDSSNFTDAAFREMSTNMWLYIDHFKTYFASVARRSQLETNPSFVKLVAELESNSPLDELALLAKDDLLAQGPRSRTVLGRLIDGTMRWPGTFLSLTRRGIDYIHRLGDEDVQQVFLTHISRRETYDAIITLVEQLDTIITSRSKVFGVQRAVLGDDLNLLLAPDRILVGEKSLLLSSSCAPTDGPEPIYCYLFNDMLLNCSISNEDNKKPHAHNNEVYFESTRAVVQESESGTELSLEYGPIRNAEHCRCQLTLLASRDNPDEITFLTTIRDTIASYSPSARA